MISNNFIFFSYADCMSYVYSIKTNDVELFENYMRGSKRLAGRIAVDVFYREYTCNTNQKILQLFVERFQDAQEIVDHLVNLVVRCDTINLQNLRYLNTVISYKAKIRGAEISMCKGNLEAVKTFKIEYPILAKMFKAFEERIPVVILPDFERYLRSQKPKRKDTSPEDILQKMLKLDINRALSRPKRRKTLSKFTVRIPSSSK